MKTEVVPHSCRVCLGKRKRLRSLYTPLQDGDATPDEMLRKLIGPEREPLSPELLTLLPQSICKSCEMSLNLAYQFHLKALRATRIIEAFCNSHTESDGKPENAEPHHIDDITAETLIEYEEVGSRDSIDVEHAMEEDLIEECIVDEELPEDATDYHQLDVVKEEEEDEHLNSDYSEWEEFMDNGDEELTTESNEDAENASHPVSGESFHDVMNIPKIDCNKDNNNEEDQDKQQQRRRLHSTVNERLRKMTKNPAKYSALNKQRAKKSSSHICDICGNMYTQRARLNAHRKGHNQELNFSCEICEKRFNMREKLRQHMITHSGSRPYKCSYCSRTFFYESVKKAHEAVHSGVKPFVCECKKAFAYAHVLKKHQLTHTDVKLYHCSYCDKDFRLRYHVTQHEQTKMHQRAVEAATKKDEEPLRRSLKSYTSLTT